MNYQVDINKIKNNKNFKKQQKLVFWNIWISWQTFRVTKETDITKIKNETGNYYYWPNINYAYEGI